MTPALRIRLLGDFLLLADDVPVTTLNSPRLQSLLAYLLLHRSAPQDRSRVAFLLWPDATEAHAHASLRKLLHQLRQTMPDVEQFLRIDKDTLYWHPAPDVAWSLDVEEMEQALEQAERATRERDTRALRLALEQVMKLYRGDLLPGCYDEWLLPERDRWHQLFLHAAERLVTLLENEREYPGAIAAAQQLLRHDSLHEATYRQLMRLHALHGDRASAQRVYHTCVTVLERELGVEPSEATRTAYKALLQVNDAPKTGPLSLRGTAPPLLGRKLEWQQLQEAWRKAARGQARIVVLTGEAGIGKTRLAEEMKAWVGRQGITTASTRCYTALGQLAYAPVTGLLRADAFQAGISTLEPAYLSELARLLPEVLTKLPKLPRPAAMTESWQRQHFFEALARVVLRARQPLLLLIDDMQWCDNETLEWLHYLLRFDPEARLLLIGTVRSEETRPDHPLVTFLSALQRDELVTEITLEALATAEATSLAEHVLGRELAATLSSMLYRESEGNPLFIVEMARAGLLDPDPAAAEVSGSRGALPLLTHQASLLPPSVQNVLAARLAQLSPLAHNVANVAAVIGREFTFAVLAEAIEEREEAVVQGLDELWQRRIVREQEDSSAEAYDFSHDKLREQVYTSLSPAYRRLLHRRVAEAFKTLYKEDLSAVSGQLAAHYEQAGLPMQAVPYYQQAGEAASRIYANAEALHAFGRATALLEAAMPGTARQTVPWETAAGIYEAYGHVLLELGRYEQARLVYQQAQTWMPTQAYIQRGRIQCQIARTWNYASNNPHDTNHLKAHEAFQEAERLLTQVTDQENPAWRDEWVHLHFSQVWPLRGSVDEMAAIIEKVRPIVEQYGSAAQRKSLKDTMGMHAAMRARFAHTEQALANRRAALVEALQTGHPGEIGTARMAIGILLMWANQLDEAEEMLTSALQTAERAGIAWMQARCLTFLPFVFRKRGQVEQVRALLVQAHAKGADQDNGVMTGHHAWVALREGRLAEAERYARSALEGQQMEVSPFLWTGLWPLVAVEFARANVAAAIEHVRPLLDQTQQPPPDQIKNLLTAVLEAWDAEQPQEARALLQQVIPLAEDGGYL